jgi:hypothetical protein
VLGGTCWLRESRRACLGPVSTADRAVDAHCRYRLRQWLCAKHQHPGTGTCAYPDEYLHRHSDSSNWNGPRAGMRANTERGMEGAKEGQTMRLQTLTATSESNQVASDCMSIGFCFGGDLSQGNYFVSCTPIGRLIAQRTRSNLSTCCSAKRPQPANCRL